MPRTKDGKRKAQSPYQKYRKTPFRYSAEHGAWFEAAKRGDEARMAEARARHTAMIERVFGPLDLAHDHPIRRDQQARRRRAA